MKFLKNIIYYLSVPKCVHCRERLNNTNFPICEICLSEYKDYKERNCSLCSKPLYNCTCTNEYLRSCKIKRLIKVFRYKAGESCPSSSLIYSLKRENRSDVVEFLASQLSESLRNEDFSKEDTVITYVPRRKRAIVKYGIDHSKMLCKELSDILGIPYADLLISKTKKVQKKTTDVSERKSNAKYELKDADFDLNGKKVIIIDDIVTSGASMGACSLLLKKLNPKEIIGASLSVAFKDSYTPF